VNKNMLSNAVRMLR